jgi:lipopolysaccharide export system permease protein
MPILWRYLIDSFLKVAVVCVLAFIAILLTMRLDDIAHFAALGAPFSYILLFTLYQVPYILPIALPLSCLIAALLLVQRLSKTHELTALRASGFALRDLLAPLLLTAAFLSLGNFWINSELATQSHLQTNLLKSELRAINPLLLLHNKHLMRLKGFHFEARGASHVGESASDVILVIPNKQQQRLNLMVAKQLKASPSVFKGERVTLITGIPQEQEDFDHLIVENIEEALTPVQDFSDLLQKKVWTINNDYLHLPLLLARIETQSHALREAQQRGETRAQLKPLREQLNRSQSEIIKRLSLACAVFTFTLMGTAFGLTISRQHSYYPLYLTITFTTLYLVTFFIAKDAGHHFLLATLLYLSPHLLIISASLLMLRRISRGIE